MSAGILVAEAFLLAVSLLLNRPFLGVGAAAALVYLALAYRHPDLAWGLVWLAFPFSIEARIPGGNALFIPTEPMIALSLLAWVLRTPVRAPLRVPPSSLHAPLVAIAMVALASAAASHYPLLGLKACIVAAAYVVFAYGYCFCRAGSARAARNWVPWVVGLGAFWGLYGSVRLLVEGVSLQHAYGAARPFFPEHGSYSAYLTMIFPLALLFAMDGKGRGRILYTLASIMIGLGIALSFTRAAWVSVVIVLPLTAVIWAWRHRSLKPFAWLAGFAAVVLVVVATIGAEGRLSQHVGSIAQSENVSTLERVNRWMAALEMAKDRPWLGVGYGAYPAAYSSHRRKVIITEMVYTYMGAHSEPFRILSETGVIGFLASIWFFAAAAVLGFRVFFRARDPKASMLALAVLAGLGTYAIHMIFNSYPGIDKVTLPFWASLGILSGLGRKQDSDKEVVKAGAGPHVDGGEGAQPGLR